MRTSCIYWDVYVRFVSAILCQNQAHEHEIHLCPGTEVKHTPEFRPKSTISTGDQTLMTICHADWDWYISSDTLRRAQRLRLSFRHFDNVMEAFVFFDLENLHYITRSKFEHAVHRLRVMDGLDGKKEVNVSTCRFCVWCISIMQVPLKQCRASGPWMVSTEKRIWIWAIGKYVGSLHGRLLLMDEGQTWSAEATGMCASPCLQEAS